MSRRLFSHKTRAKSTSSVTSTDPSITKVGDFSFCSRFCELFFISRRTSRCRSLSTAKHRPHNQSRMSRSLYGRLRTQTSSEFRILLLFSLRFQFAPFSRVSLHQRFSSECVHLATTEGSIAHQFMRDNQPIEPSIDQSLMMGVSTAATSQYTIYWLRRRERPARDTPPETPSLEAHLHTI